ncbi:MAG TPA: lysine--tRNA ligase [Candidatus Aenigmarchaeota archaeon]|nr:lysine--tRNA ligase [Candidatus Aenigmarchaeota archaeon]
MEETQPVRSIIEERIKKLKKLIELGIEPFAYHFERTHKIVEILQKFSKIKVGEIKKGKKVKVAGRIVALRIHGKAGFADIEDSSEKIQLYFKIDTIGEKLYNIFTKLLDIGDIISVEGFVFRTHKGELSVWVENFCILAKSLRPLPSKWYGLKDVELRYRQRYLDLIMNKEMRDRAILISRIVNAMREFLIKRGFVEVETPALQTVYGGAFARPFETYHNFLKQKMYLRIAPELYLKRLIVGGLEKVFEFAKCFRNESVDATHNPEFTQIELYQAYANYEDTMKLIEEMFYFVVKKVLGKNYIEYQGNRIKLKPPWRRVTMVDAIKKYGKIDVTKLSDKELTVVAKENEVKGIRRGELIEGLFEKLAQPKLIQPTFITMFPADITPLAKRSKKNPGFTERYEGYIAGLEVCNGYTELNNPIEQFKRFKEEEELRKRVKKELEYMPMDRDFVRALEFGMPPTSGVGIGVARVLSLFTNTTSIKEVILFPAVSGREKIKTVADMFPEVLKMFD